MRTGSPSLTPSAKLSMKEPSASVDSWLALFPTTVTVAPSIGVCDCLSLTTPDIVNFFVWPSLDSENASVKARNAALGPRLIVCVAAEPSSPLVRHLCQAAENPSCLRAAGGASELDSEAQS